MRLLIGLLIAVLSFPANFAEAAPRLKTVKKTPERLVRLVVLSRHGVRSPTQSSEVLSLWASRPWPHWPVGRGELTPRGSKLIARQWRELRRAWIGQGLLASRACPEPGEIAIVADSEQRTRETARALAAALAPGCATEIRATPEVVEPLFHPTRTGHAVVDAAQARPQMEASLGNLSVTNALGVIQAVSDCCAARLCREVPETPCSLAAIPTRPVFENGDAGLQGGLAVASSLAEIFLLEYGQWPDRNAGWGEVDGTILRQILPVHNQVFDVLNRAPAVARARGGALLRAVRDSLLTSSGTRLTVYVGHDTNIANLGGLLDLNWDFPEQGRNTIPPGGALVFSLWENGEGSREIRASFLGPSLATLHMDDPDASPVEVSAGLTCNGAPCTPEAFTAFVDQVLQEESGR